MNQSQKVMLLMNWWNTIWEKSLCLWCFLLYKSFPGSQRDDSIPIPSYSNTFFQINSYSVLDYPNAVLQLVILIFLTLSQIMTNFKGHILSFCLKIDFSFRKGFETTYELHSDETIRIQQEKTTKGCFANVFISGVDVFRYTCSVLGNTLGSKLSGC